MKSQLLLIITVLLAACAHPPPVSSVSKQTPAAPPLAPMMPECQESPQENPRLEEQDFFPAAPVISGRWHRGLGNPPRGIRGYYERSDGASVGFWITDTRQFCRHREDAASPKLRTIRGRTARLQDARPETNDGCCAIPPSPRTLDLYVGHCHVEFSQAESGAEADLIEAANTVLDYDRLSQICGES